jgi:heat shock protein HslJ
MKQSFFLLLLLSLLCTGCKDDNKGWENLSSLEDTKWKLAGIVDETGTLKVLEPKGCERCYMLTFDTDSTFYSNSATNGIWGSYEINYKTSAASIHCQTITEVAAMGDERFYIETLNNVQSFYLQNNTLKLHYNRNKNYLLFKLQQS